MWGAGNIGTALVHRLALAPFVSEIHWTNRTHSTIKAQTVDLEHGLAYTSRCRSIEAHPEHAPAFVAASDVIVITAGKKVPQGSTRAKVYQENRDVLRAIAPALKGYSGPVLVVSNPVDLMARTLYREAGLDRAQVFGLGTVVETARLRASLGASLGIPAGDVWAYGIGTHDETFVAQSPLPCMGVGVELPLEDAKLLLAAARDEAARGARRVRALHPKAATLFPIVEGILEVLGVISADRNSVLTVSVLDPESAEGLFYSVPCSIGNRGVTRRAEGIGNDPGVAEGLKRCTDGLLDVLQDAGDL